LSFVRSERLAPDHRDARLDAVRKVAPLKREFKALLQRGSKGKRHKLVRGFANNPLKLWPALWTFAAVPGVEPTNN
jgi:hypothetical protein